MLIDTNVVRLFETVRVALNQGMVNCSYMQLAAVGVASLIADLQLCLSLSDQFPSSCSPYQTCFIGRFISGMLDCRSFVFIIFIQMLFGFM